MNIEMHIPDFHKIFSPEEFRAFADRSALIVPDNQQFDDHIGLGKIVNPRQGVWEFRGQLYERAVVPEVIFNGKGYHQINPSFAYGLWSQQQEIRNRFHRTEVYVPLNRNVDDMISELYETRSALFWQQAYTSSQGFRK